MGDNEAYIVSRFFELQGWAMELGLFFSPTPTPDCYQFILIDGTETVFECDTLDQGATFYVVLSTHIS